MKYKISKIKKNKFDINIDEYIKNIVFVQDLKTNIFYIIIKNENTLSEIKKEMSRLEMKISIKELFKKFLMIL